MWKKNVIMIVITFNMKIIGSSRNERFFHEKTTCLIKNLYAAIAQVRNERKEKKKKFKMEKSTFRVQKSTVHFFSTYCIFSKKNNQVHIHAFFFRVVFKRKSNTCVQFLSFAYIIFLFYFEASKILNT